MSNNFCPFLNGPCKNDCVFVEYRRGLTSFVPSCALANRIKNSRSLDTKALADSLRLLTTAKNQP